MRGLVRRTVLAAGAVLVLVGVSAGSAVAVAGPAELGFQPTSHEFGPVPLGQHRDLTLTLTNTGDRASSGLTVSLTGSTAYAVTADKCSGHTLGPRKSCTVNVRFAPTVDGAANATVTATGKHRVAPAGVTLTGRGGGFGSGAPGHLYWTSENQSFVYSVNSSPLTANPLTLTPVASPLTGANFLAVSQTVAYWTDDGTLFDGTVSSVPLAGGPVTTLVSGLNSPQGIAVDSSYVYWGTFGDGTVSRIPVGGGSTTALVVGQGAISGVAVGGGNIYWATYTGTSTGGEIHAAPLTATGVGAQTVVIGGLNSPTGLAVDGGQLYWTDFSDGTANGSVNAIPVGGGPVTVIASNQTGPNGVGVADGQVYWANSDGTINRAPTSGAGPVTQLYSSLFDSAFGVAVGP